MKKFISIFIPSSSCNLRCHYCYVTHHKMFDGEIPDFKYTPDELKQALSKKRLGGVSLINFCASGETLIPEIIIHYVNALLAEGHYVMIVTNGLLTKRIEKLCGFEEEYRKRLFIKFSYQYLELKKRGLIDVFFSNIISVRNAGISFSVELTACDELMDFVDDACEYSINYLGAKPHVTIGRDERVAGELPILTDLNEKEYYSFWNKMGSSFFQYKQTIFGVKRKEFCYAGAWSGILNICTGNMSQCYKFCYSQNIFNDLNKPIRFFPVGNNCMSEHCYNGHVFIALGVIPELNAPTYFQLRHKDVKSGGDWIGSEMKSFLSRKLFDYNDEYDAVRKNIANLECLSRKLVKSGVRSVVKYIRK
ncbi:MAG: radical SAM protein [Prosthecochloris sp.]|nr:radical SAM protein [Prosthecochloris sp.]